MSRGRFTLVLVLLVLILLVASLLFGLLTYWLSPELLSESAGSQDGPGPVDDRGRGAATTEMRAEAPGPAASPASRRFCQGVAM